MKVLVIDEDESVREDLSGLFESNGYDILSASNGKDGIDLVSIESPDLVVTNLIMPGMNGFNICRAIRMNRPNTPVIFITSFNYFDKFFPDFAARADAFFTKPVNHETLLSCAAELLAQRNIVQSAYYLINERGSLRVQSRQRMKTIMLADWYLPVLCRKVSRLLLKNGKFLHVVHTNYLEEVVALLPKLRPDLLISQPSLLVKEDYRLIKAAAELQPAPQILAWWGNKSAPELLREYGNYHSLISTVELPCPIDNLAQIIDELLA